MDFELPRRRAGRRRAGTQDPRGPGDQRAAEGARGGGAPRDDELWKALAEANLLGTAIPEEHGGSDLGFLALCACCCRRWGARWRRSRPSPRWCWARCPWPASARRSRSSAWLPGVASGERIVTAALTEPGLERSAGVTRLTRAEPTARRFRLTGLKTHVPCARAGEPRPGARALRRRRRSIGLFFVEPRPTVRDRAAGDLRRPTPRRSSSTMRRSAARRGRWPGGGDGARNCCAGWSSTRPPRAA